MSEQAELNITPLLHKLKAVSTLAGADMKDMLRSEARLFVYNAGTTPGIINITPPFSQQARDASSAQAAGRLAIRRDLGAVFSPVQLKGRRAITQVFGRKLAAPIYVPTKEKHPDVAAVARERWIAKNAAKRKIMGRGRKQAYYVDQSKLTVVLRESYALVGTAAACWYVAALQAGLQPRGVPDWVRRHRTAFAAGDIIVTRDSLRITLASSLPYNVALGMIEKVRRVLGYRENSLARRLPYVVAALARKSGFTSTSSTNIPAAA